VFKIKQPDAEEGEFLYVFDAYRNNDRIHTGYSFEQVADTKNITRHYVDALFETKEDAERWVAGHMKPCDIVEV